MKNELTRSIQNIRQAMLANKLVIFAGAGISVDSGVPLWNSLKESLKADLTDVEHEHDNLKVPQLYFIERGHKEYYDKLRQVLQPGKQLPNGIHKAILELEPEHIITTNFDDLLEKEVDRQGRFYFVVRRDQEVSNRLIIKMHGDFTHENLVLKEDDFLEYERKFPLIERTVQGLFASHTILFVGISFEDPNLKMILQKVRNILDTAIRPAYLISPTILTDAQRNYLRDKGVFVIDATPDLEKAFMQLPKIEKGESSSFGLRVIKILSLIKDFDRVLMEGLPGIWQKISQELNRYTDLKALPVEMFPKLESVKHPQVQNYVLGFESPELYRFVKELEQRNPLDTEAHAKIRAEFAKNKKTMKRALSILRNSGIYWIRVESGRPTNFKDMSFAIDLGQRTKDDNPNNRNYCPICSFWEFDFRSVNSALRHLRDEPIRGKIEDLKLPYLLFLIQDYNGCLYRLLEIKSMAWQIGNLSLYFLACYNLNVLHQIWPEWPLPRVIEKPLELDAILHSMPSNAPLKDVFSELYNGRLYYRNYFKTLEQAFKVKGEIESARQSEVVRSGFGPSLESMILQRWHFFDSNFLTSLFHVENQRAFEIGFETMVESYLREDKHNDGVDEFHPFFLMIALVFSRSKELRRILFRLGNRTLYMGDEQKQKFLDRIHNFFHTSGDPEFKFGNRLGEIFVNLLCLTPYISFTPEEINGVVTRILNHPVCKDSKLFGANERELGIFISKVLPSLSPESLRLILGNNYILQGRLLPLVRDCIGRLQGLIEDQPQEISEIADKAVMNYPDKMDGIDLIHLWDFASQKGREGIWQRVKKSLEGSWHISDLLTAAYKGILDLESEGYHDRIFDRLMRTFSSNEDINRWGLKSNRDHEAALFAQFLHHEGFDLNDARVVELRKISRAFDFFIAPDQFDYDQFDFAWLWSFGNSFADRCKQVEAFHASYQKAMKADNISIKYARVYRKFFY
jgi:hypothetical protein